MGRIVNEAGCLEALLGLLEPIYVRVVMSELRAGKVSFESTFVLAAYNTRVVAKGYYGTIF